MQLNLFAEETQLAKLSKLGDSLERRNVIDFESFRPTIGKAFVKEHKSNAGRPAFDSVMMFKTLILQRLFNLSDDQTEYQITDRISFLRFPGLSLGERVPDAKTIWLFKDTLSKSGVIDTLFSQFGAMLESKGIITHTGTIVDATFVDAPRQRNSREENRQIKNGEVPDEWEENPHRLAQKDTDARWTKKGGETHFGYKDHTKVDAESKLITDYSVTPANVHDSNEFVDFIDETDREVYADSAYTGKDLPGHVKNRVHEKGFRGHPLTVGQKESNREKSKTRSRIEHVFGFMTMSMRGLTLRCIGIGRATFNIGLTNLIYNMCRYAFLRKRGGLRHNYVHLRLKKRKYSEKSTITVKNTGVYSVRAPVFLKQLEICTEILGSGAGIIDY